MGLPSRLRQVGLISATTLVVVGLVAGVFGDDSWWWGAGWLAFPVVGALILLKRPGHPIGRLLWLTGALWTLSWLGYQLDGPPLGHAPAWIELVTSLGGYLAWPTLIAIVALFPTGRAEGRGTRVLVLLIGLSAACIAVAVVVSTAPLEISGRANPLGISWLEFYAQWFITQGFVVVPLLLVASLVSLMVRWRRSDGVERLQYQWLAWSVVLSVSVIVVANYVRPEESSDGRGIQLSDLVFIVGLNAVPVAIGIAVTRYRLYEIDRVASRAVSYILVSAAVISVYAGIVTLVTWLLPVSSGLAVAAGTLAAAAAFRPLYSAIQRGVDRRFNRPRYDAERIVEEFAARLRDDSVSRLVGRELLTVVEHTVQPSAAGVWIRAAG